MTGLKLDPRYEIFPVSGEELNSLRERTYSLIREELRRQGLPEDCCALGVPDAGDDGRLCFHDEGGVWLFYVAERGLRRQAAMFQSAYAGANYLIWFLVCDPKKRNLDVGCLPFI